MLTMVGLTLVLVAVLGGFLLEKGNLLVLVQPAEFVIIGGAAIGALLAANSPKIVREVLSGLKLAFKPERYDSAMYLKTLTMIHDLFVSARKEGAAQLEAHIESPAESPILQRYPEFLNNRSALTYFCDTVRVILMGGVNPHEIEQLMELDAESHQAEAAEPVHALQTMADALPGLGIVAAVLGVVITMGSLGGPATEVGHKVAAALVGTFLGVLLCYGFVGPLSQRLTRINEAEAQYFLCLRQAVLAYVRGCGPLLAAEVARRAVPPHLRPTFQDFEAACKGTPAPEASEDPEQAAA